MILSHQELMLSLTTAAECASNEPAGFMFSLFHFLIMSILLYYLLFCVVLLFVLFFVVHVLPLFIFRYMQIGYIVAGSNCHFPLCLSSELRSTCKGKKLLRFRDIYW